MTHQKKDVGTAKERMRHAIKMRARHMLRAGYWRGHHIHSPYAYHLVRDVITTRQCDKELRTMTRLFREAQETNKKELSVKGLGAIERPVREITVAELAKQTGVNEKYGLMLARIARDLNPKSILELGTSVGISTAYLAIAVPKTEVVTIEGDLSSANAAQTAFAKQGLTNIRSIVANIDNCLEDVIESLPNGQVEMAFVDANHSETATMQYFETIAKHAAPMSIVIFDDIYWSEGMTRAWRNIAKDPRTMMTFELTRMGIIVFRKGCQKEHFMLRW